MDNTWHDGPEWEGWTKRIRHNAVERAFPVQTVKMWIDCLGSLKIDEDHCYGDILLSFPTPAAALSVANAIIAAWNAEHAQGERL